MLCLNEGSGVQQDNYTRWTVCRLSCCERHLGTRSMAVRALVRFSGTETEQNTTNSVSLTILRRTNGNEVLLMFSLIVFKAKLPTEIEFRVVCAEYLVSGPKYITVLTH